MKNTTRVKKQPSGQKIIEHRGIKNSGLAKRHDNSDKKGCSNQNQIRPKNRTETAYEGIISIRATGDAYIRSVAHEYPIPVAIVDINHAFQGDRVLFETKGSGRTMRAKVIKTLSHFVRGFAGTVTKKGSLYVLVPEDARVYATIVLPKEQAATVTQTDTVFATITRWTGITEAQGIIEKVLGKTGAHETVMQATALASGFDSVFPDRVLKEAASVAEKATEEYANPKRRDYTHVKTFTIDPFDAKDFDDALSVKKNTDGSFEIGVHIADVSFFVTPESLLDKEAYTRGTSVYLVDRTIPMLPEILSNDLCSLRPKTKRLAMSVIWTIDNRGKIRNSWFGRTVIFSDKRFTYEEAQQVLDDGTGPFFEELTILNDLAKIFEKKRARDGALAFDTEEVKFTLDQNGHPTGVTKKIRTQTMHLVEEWMLLANKSVAELFGKTKGKLPFVYRVHDLPDAERLAQVKILAESAGINFGNKTITDAKGLQKLLESLVHSPLRSIIETMVIRSMAKAIYTTKNIGHYGLAFEDYTHFTSPIRRYPDVLVHRLLERELNKKPLPKHFDETLEAMALHSGERERAAAKAERDSIKYKQVEYMSTRIGNEYDGIISGISDFGIHVEEKETKSEGLVSLRTLPADSWIVEKGGARLLGSKTKKIYSLGDTVRIRVVKADITKRMLDYVLV